MKTQKNVTLSLPEPLLRRFRVYAASRNRSMTALMTEAIAKMLDQDRAWEKNKREFLDRIRKAPRRTANGTVTWTRAELHER